MERQPELAAEQPIERDVGARVLLGELEPGRILDHRLGLILIPDDSHEFELPELISFKRRQVFALPGAGSYVEVKRPKRVAPVSRRKTLTFLRLRFNLWRGGYNRWHPGRLACAACLLERAFRCVRKIRQTLANRRWRTQEFFDRGGALFGKAAFLRQRWYRRSEQ
jgi:hypothetical protein